MKRRQFLKSVGLGAIAAGGISISSAAKKDRPNVLFIPVDDLNHWCSYTGRNKQAKTPNIDRISKRGVSFLNSHCAVPACEPARAALLGGRRPWTTGCYLNGHTWKKHVPEGTTLPATFKKAGYYVAGTGKVFHGAGGIEKVYASEWDDYAEPKTPYGGGATKMQGYHEPLPLDMKDEDLRDWHSANYCIKQLQKKHEKPFFLACGMIKPHLPWAVPRKYYKMFPRDKVELPPHIEGDLDDVPPAGRKIGCTTDHPKFLKSGRWKDAVQSYLATVAYVDMCIGRVLDALEKSAYKDNTIIVLWGDHGWHLGEKEHWRKFTLWEEATRAPLIWYAPGVTKADTKCSRPVDFMSIYPTLCDLAGIEIPEYVEGKSIRKLLENPDAKWDGVAITTYGYKNHAVKTEKWRYIQYKDGSEELYDETADQYEWKNLAEDAKYADVKKELAAHLPTKNAPQGQKNSGHRKPKKKKKKD